MCMVCACDMCVCICMHTCMWGGEGVQSRDSAGRCGGLWLIDSRDLAKKSPSEEGGATSSQDLRVARHLPEHRTQTGPLQADSSVLCLQLDPGLPSRGGAWPGTRARGVSSSSWHHLQGTPSYLDGKGQRHLNTKDKPENCSLVANCGICSGAPNAQVNHKIIQLLNVCASFQRFILSFIPNNILMKLNLFIIQKHPYL